MINWSRKAVAAFATLCLLANGAMAIPMPSANPIPQNKGAPTQHRLAYAGAGGMAVSWNTYEALSNPTVWYGTSPDSLTRSASSSISQTYNTSTTWSNHVKISGLAPNTKYYYKVSNSDDSQVYSFTTAPSSDYTNEFKFAMVIDMGTMGPLGLSEVSASGSGNLLPGERNTVDALKANLDGYEFLWHPGDIAYADYWLKEQIQGYLPAVNVTTQGYKVYESILNEFYEQIEDISAKKPYMVGPGNHEANCDNGGTKDKKKGINYSVDICVPGQTDFTGYNSHWRMPSQESGGKKNMWYSYDYGQVHFVQLNTETDFGNGIVAPDESGTKGKEFAKPFGSYANEQIDWLNKDLANVDRCKTPWIIVSGHRPWYTSGNGNNCWQCQTAFESTLNKYNVDLAVFGHVHNYQRFEPMNQNQTDPNGLNNPSAPWYIVNGAGGHYDGIDSLGDSAKGLAYGLDGVYGWSRFTVHNNTHLTHEFVASGDDSVRDTATLFKKHDFSQCKVLSSSSISSSSYTSTSTIASSVSSGSSTIVGTSSTGTSTYASTSSSKATVSPYTYSLTSSSQNVKSITEPCTSSVCTSTASSSTQSVTSGSNKITSSAPSDVISTTTVVTVTEPCPATTVNGKVVTETEVVKTLTVPCPSCTKSSATSASNSGSVVTVVTVTEPCAPTTISGKVVTETAVVKTVTVSCTDSKCAPTQAPATTAASSKTTVVDSSSKPSVISTGSSPYQNSTIPKSTGIVTSTVTSCKNCTTVSPPVNVPTTTTVISQVNGAAAPIVHNMVIAAAAAGLGLMML